LTWMVLRIVPGRSAPTRFAVWFSTLVAVVGLPLLVRSGSSADWHKPGLELSSSWAMCLFLVWAAIAFVLLIRLAGSLWHVRRLRRESSEVDGESQPELVLKFAQHSTGRNVRLLVSHEVRVPTALGFFRPAVILPAWTLEQLSAEELNLLLLHELAHLERWDDWTNLAQKILKAVFFFHPAVWWIDNRLSLEREIACDDLVLEETSSPRRYAESLVALAEKVFAEKMRVRAALAVAQSALGRMHHTSRRIAEILHPGRGRQRQGWQVAVTAITAVSAVAVVATPYVPELISFQQQAVLRAASPSMVDTVPAVKASSRIPVRPILPLVPARVKVHRASKSRVVMTKVTVDRKARKPNVILTRATGDQAPLPMLLLMQSIETDSSRQTVWVFCIWRMSSEVNGYRQIEQTIVMNQI
jgi:bla regulator protein blaR1